MVNKAREEVPESGDATPYKCVLEAALESGFSEPKTVERREGAMDADIYLVERGSGLTHVNRPEKIAKLCGLWNHFLLVARVSSFLASKIGADPSLALNLAIAVHLGKRLREEAIDYKEASFSAKHDMDKGTDNDQEVFYALDMLGRDFEEVPADLLTLISSWKGMQPIAGRPDLEKALLCTSYADARCADEVVEFGKRLAGQFKRWWIAKNEDGECKAADDFTDRDDEGLADFFTAELKRISEIQDINVEERTRLLRIAIDNRLGAYGWDPNAGQYRFEYVVGETGGYFVILELDKELQAAGVDTDNLGTDNIQAPEWELQFRTEFLQRVEPIVRTRLSQINGNLSQLDSEFPIGTWYGDYARAL